MRFLALALFVVATATCCLGLTADVAELENMAKLAGAPFTQKSLEMMKKSELWGVNRQNRSSDVVIFNTSEQPFKLNMTSCLQGKVSEVLVPAAILNGKSSIVYGLESSAYLRGVQCTILYGASANDHSWFSLIHVPSYGDNNAYAFYSSDLKITTDVGAGSNNQVTFTIKDDDSHRSLRSAQTRGRPLKKPKGNRNNLVKKSKRGSRSHRLQASYQ